MAPIIDTLSTAPLARIMLCSVAVVWCAVLVTALVDRCLYARRTRRLARIQEQLRGCNGDPAGVPRLTRRIRRLTIDELETVLRAGTDSSAAAARIWAEGRRPEGLVRAAVDEKRPFVRIAAARLLVAIQQERRHEVLERMLRSTSEVVAAASVQMLARAGDRRSAAILIEGLRDGVHPRARLAAALDAMPAVRAAAFRPLFESSDPEVRFWAIKLACRKDAVIWSARIRELSADGDARVRRAAIEALGLIGDAGSMAILIHRLNDPVPFVRAHAARACGVLRDAGAAQAVAELLADRSWIVRVAARDGLQRMGPVAVPAVTRALWHGDRFAAASAAQVLQQIGLAAEAARRVLASPAAAGPDRPTLARFLRVGGTYVRAAFFGELDRGDRRALIALLEDGAERA